MTRRKKERKKERKDDNWKTKIGQKEHNCRDAVQDSRVSRKRQQDEKHRSEEEGEKNDKEAIEAKGGKETEPTRIEDEKR